MLKVKVKIRYCYAPALGKFESRMTFFLPAEENIGNIITLLSIFQSPKEFLDIKLDSTWGERVIRNGEKMRKRGATVYAASWEEIRRKTITFVKQKITFLKEIVRENREKLKLVEGKEEEEKTYLI